jgi:hypothetical protein
MHLRTDVALLLGTAGVLVCLSSASGATASTGLDEWEPARVVDAQPKIERPTALFSTELGRAVVVYDAGKTTWVSSRPSGSARSWTTPQQLVGAPDDVFAGPVAVGSGGGAVVFLQSDFAEIAYASMTPEGEWTEARAFPYQSTFVPDVALVRPKSGIVTVGTTGYGRVRAAVKPQGKHWRLSPGLDLGFAVVRGAWYDANSRVHVLVAQHAHADRRQAARHSRNLYEVILRHRDGGLTWGRLRLVPRGTDGTLAAASDVSVLSNADDAITLLWREYGADGYTRQYVRHRDPVEGWTPAHRLPDPALGLPVVGTLADDGTTRLAYLTSPAGAAEEEYALVTRLLTADGTLGEEQVLDTFVRDNLGFDGVVGAHGGVLLRWRSNTDDDQEQHLFRCLAGSGCAAVGSWNAVEESFLALTPDGAGFAAGVGDAVPGCPADAICARRLPTTEGTP